MCNCGKNRTALKQQSNTAQNFQHKTETVPVQTKSTVIFQYTGKTALTITGNITKKSYRFNFPGDIQHINSSDAMALGNISVLKRL